jgi:hypothetical protein
MIAAGQGARNRHRLHGEPAHHAGAAAQQLEDVRVALVRHDGGAGRELGRDPEVPVLLGREQHHVPGEGAEVAGHRPQRAENHGLELAAAELGRGRAVAGAGAAQPLGTPLRIERQRRPVAGRAAERRHVGEVEGRREGAKVVEQALGVAAGPQPHRRRHRPPQVGVARHQHPAVAAAELEQGTRRVEGRAHDLEQAVAGEENQRGQHLVVARAAGVDLLPGRAEASTSQPSSAVWASSSSSPTVSRPLAISVSACRSSSDQLPRPRRRTAARPPPGRHVADGADASQRSSRRSQRRSSPAVNSATPASLPSAVAPQRRLIAAPPARARVQLAAAGDLVELDRTRRRCGSGGSRRARA